MKKTIAFLTSALAVFILFSCSSPKTDDQDRTSTEIQEEKLQLKEELTDIKIEVEEELS
jgi:hypothetical protein